jgi:parallel beta-helix repeat protein
VEFHGNSCNNTVYENRIDNNADGMIFYYDSNNNTVYNNTIAFNRNLGIYFKGASNNRFFRNDIVENSDQTVCWYCTNIWDNGTQGNYWSDYNGTDTDGDGIGQEPYLILTLHLDGEHYDTDNYPRVDEFKIPEFPSWSILVAGLSIVLILSIIFRQKIKKGRKT